jgi:hypothetical protein
VVIPGTGRIIQLRVAARRHRLKDARVQNSGGQLAGSEAAPRTPSVEVPPRSS